MKRMLVFLAVVSVLVVVVRAGAAPSPLAPNEFDQLGAEPASPGPAASPAPSASAVPVTTAVPTVEDKLHDVQQTLERIASSLSPEARQRSLLESKAECLLRQRSAQQHERDAALREHQRVVGEQRARLDEVVRFLGGRDRVLANGALQQEIWDVARPLVAGEREFRRRMQARDANLARLERQISTVRLAVLKGQPVRDEVGEEPAAVPDDDTDTAAAKHATMTPDDQRQLLELLHAGVPRDARAGAGAPKGPARRPSNDEVTQ